MMLQAPASHDLVLVGGGHAHALALRMLAMQPIEKTRITLVSPQPMTPYSGMLPGLIAGHYGFSDTHIDLPHLCRWADVRYIQQGVRALDTMINRLTLDDGSHLDFDWLSLNVGGTPSFGGVPGAASFAVPVKPVSTFFQRWQTLLDRWQTEPAATSRSLVVVGAGAGGCELVLAMAHALARRQLQANLTLVGDTLLPGANARVRNKMRAALARYDIRLAQARVTRVSADQVHTDSDTLASDTTFWCSGVNAPAWLADAGLGVDADGFVTVDAQLRSTSHPHVFAAGDCARQVGADTPRAGVYAVRQSRYLAHNLKAAIEGGRLRQYTPQRQFLSLLSLGARDAIASRNGMTLSAPWVWRWKNRIDQAFMQTLHALPARPAMPPIPTEEPPRCAGCGAKVGDGALREALATLQPLEHRDIVSGLASREDASAVRWHSNALLVQSQDYFPAFVDDPHLFGRLAALHSLSDVYARGAQPHSALATVCLPIHHNRLQGRDLGRLMHGAVQELNRAGCALLGGHTIEGAQMAAGFAINAAGREDELFAKGGARPGDQLVLTKPLGTGVLLAALMHPQRCGEWFEPLVQAMLQSNADAVALLRQFSIRAVTDVTGFGLLGHSLEMCDASHAALRLFGDRIPALPGAMSLFSAGVHSSLKAANDTALTRCDISAHWLHHPLLALLTDPQTCGGLIAAVPADQFAACRERFARQQQPLWHIGEWVAPASEQAPVQLV